MKRNSSKSEDEIRIARLIESRAYPQLAVVARRLLARVPDHPLGLKALGVALISLGRHEEAMPQLRRGATLYPGDPEMQSNLAIALAANGEFSKSLKCIELALELEPQRADFHANRALALLHLGLPVAAIESCHTAIHLNPRHPEAFNTLGAAFHNQRKFEDALAAFQVAVEIRPESLDAFINFVVTLADLGRHDQAANCARQVFEQGELSQAESDMLLPHICAAERACCDWRRADLPGALHGILQRQVDQGPEPFFMTHIEGIDRAALRHGAAVYGHAYLRGKVVDATQSGVATDRTPEQSKRALRIGFLSADFRAHPVSELAVGVYETLDRDQFSVFAYAYGPSDSSALGQRLRAAFDEFRDIDGRSFADAAALIRHDAVDILVDMAGWTKFSRAGILAHSPAPVVASWLGFPGTLGVANLAHYIMSDAVVTPLDHAHDYVEQLALMPHTYQPSSRVRDVLATPSRSALGLPEEAFVFCSFNQSVKITPAMFGLWCELLQRNPGSILWLGFQSGLAQANLCRAAEARGVNAARIVFAPWLELAEHHARLAQADLALETFPYGSHTTGSDMLWAGVPLIALQGDTFASRVSASLLHAVGLPELVAHSAAEYLALADALAKDPERCRALRHQLRAARVTAPLFDTRRFGCDLGRLFQSMWQNHLTGRHRHIQLSPLTENSR